jgi:hypothetical protein
MESIAYIHRTSLFHLQRVGSKRLRLRHPENNILSWSGTSCALVPRVSTGSWRCGFSCHVCARGSHWPKSTPPRGLPFVFDIFEFQFSPKSWGSFVAWQTRLSFVMCACGLGWLWLQNLSHLIVSSSNRIEWSTFEFRLEACHKNRQSMYIYIHTYIYIYIISFKFNKGNVGFHWRLCCCTTICTTSMNWVFTPSMISETLSRSVNKV